MKLDYFEQFKNAIVCSYKNYRAVSAKYPNKRVYPDMVCPNTMYYYFNRKGVARHYSFNTGRLMDFCQGNFVSVYVPTKYRVAYFE